MLRVVKWGNKAVNTFFRIIYSEGLWLPRAVAAEAIRHGWIVTALCLQCFCIVMLGIAGGFQLMYPDLS